MGVRQVLRLLRQKKVRDALAGLALLMATAGLVAAPEEAIAGAKDGLTLCFNVIVPSPFLCCPPWWWIWGWRLTWAGPWRG